MAEVRVVDLRLAVPVALGWVTTVILVGVPEAQVVAVPVLWAFAAGAVALTLRFRVLGVVALALVIAALCATAVALQAPSRAPAVLVEASASGGRVPVVVRATSVITPDARSWQGVVVSANDAPMDVPVIIFGGAPDRRTDIGTTLTATVRLEATDAGDHSAFILFPDDAAEAIRDPPWYLEWANHLRRGFLAAASSLPGQGGDLLAGLAIGDTTAVDQSLGAAMKASSLTHLTAVSGANCAIVIGLVLLAGAAIGLPRGARVAISLLVLVGFVILVTPEPSVLRAAMMAAIVLVLLALGRPVRGLPVLSLAVFALLLVDPWLSRTYGFALSVLATAGLLLLASPLAERLAAWMPRPIAFGIAVPTAAQLACQPVIVLLDPTLPTYGVVANILAAPAAPLATVVGLAACLILPVVPPVGAALCSLAWVPAAWIAAVAGFFAGMPGARLPWIGGPVGVGALIAVSGGVVLLILARGTTRRVTALVLALGMVAYGSSVVTTRVVELLGRPAGWQVAACDIGQGDAVLFRSGAETALVDTGPDPARLGACLDDLGVERLDLLVLTHFDHDHVGGADRVIGKVDRVLVGPSGEPSDDELVQRFEAAGARIDHASRGLTGLLGSWRWTVLWPPGGSGRAVEPGNPASIVTSFEPVGDCPAGCLSALMLGDLGEDSQRRLVPLGSLPHPDIVGVAHHGSADQYPETYSRLGATIGVIGVGADNGYGHPTSEALGMLAAAGTTVVRTDTAGLILIAPGPDGRGVEVWTAKSPEDAAPPGDDGTQR
ncbi:competence protein ComEC [Leifsonia sp. AK011]|uniref:ComEC/Rec2 family competence protein n=1 Tax=Leifsonia sp. AK011 TaxID=2723075 RepID=UPI0015C81FCD|nr:ComEC/Rec2 family competence protein [Leifsonia sp. AK011]NYF10979.1 competence protein ComEC [Leifsonia sp. AK011]